MMSNTVLLDLNHYNVFIGPIKLDGDDVTGYVVWNKGTQIVEYETRVLPEAFIWAETLDKDLIDFYNKKTADEITNVDDIVTH